MSELSQRDFANLARFRYAIRTLLRATEEAAREAGLTPNQHQLLLGIAGFRSESEVTISDLADFLQLRHHSVVELIDRVEDAGFVRRDHNPADRRQVFITLTVEGTKKLKELAPIHRRELNGARRTLDLLEARDRRR